MLHKTSARAPGSPGGSCFARGGCRGGAVAPVRAARSRVGEIRPPFGRQRLLEPGEVMAHLWGQFQEPRSHRRRPGLQLRLPGIRSTRGRSQVGVVRRQPFRQAPPLRTGGRNPRPMKANSCASADSSSASSVSSNPLPLYRRTPGTISCRSASPVRCNRGSSPQTGRSTSPKTHPTCAAVVTPWATAPAPTATALARAPTATPVRAPAGIPPPIAGTRTSGTDEERHPHRTSWQRSQRLEAVVAVSDRLLKAVLTSVAPCWFMSCALHACIIVP